MGGDQPRDLPELFGRRLSLSPSGGAKSGSGQRQSARRPAFRQKADILASWRTIRLWNPLIRGTKGTLWARLIACHTSASSKRTSPHDCATVVLIGAETASRRYVDYEIKKSIARGNGLFGIRIHTIKDRNGQTDFAGTVPNALTEAGVPIYAWEYGKLGTWVEEAFYSTARR